MRGPLKELHNLRSTHTCALAFYRIQAHMLIVLSYIPYMPHIHIHEIHISYRITGIHVPHAHMYTRIHTHARTHAHTSVHTS